jgi:hypothetical protein
MRKSVQPLLESSAVPDNWMSAIWVFFLGTLSGILGAAGFAPGGYSGLGKVLLWGGTTIMCIALLVGAAVFLRLWRPPGLNESEWP